MDIYTKEVPGFDWMYFSAGTDATKFHDKNSTTIIGIEHDNYRMGVIVKDINEGIAYDGLASNITIELTGGQEEFQLLMGLEFILDALRKKIDKSDFNYIFDLMHKKMRVENIPQHLQRLYNIDR